MFIDINTGVVEPSAPATMAKLDAEERRRTFEQIELGFAEDEAVRGAELCLQCVVRRQRTLRPAAAEHRRRCLQQPLPGHGVARLRRARRHALHRLRPQPLHPLRPLRLASARRCSSARCSTSPSAASTRSSPPRSAAPWSRPTCEMCGNCVSACPTGALQDKLSRRRGAHLATRRPSTTVCPVLRLRLQHRAAGQATAASCRSRRRSARAPGEGNLCVKGRYGYQFIGHPDRLTQPLVRRDGELVPASWDEALELVARRFAEIKARARRRRPRRLLVGALHQRGQLPLPEVHARRHRHAQRRPLRAALPRLDGHRSAPVARAAAP